MLSIALISWGVVGHKTVATIAENHLTPKSKEMVKALTRAALMPKWKLLLDNNGNVTL